MIPMKIFTVVSGSGNSRFLIQEFSAKYVMSLQSLTGVVTERNTGTHTHTRTHTICPRALVQDTHTNTHTQQQHQGL